MVFPETFLGHMLDVLGSRCGARWVQMGAKGGQQQ